MLVYSFKNLQDFTEHHSILGMKVNRTSCIEATQLITSNDVLTELVQRIKKLFPFLEIAYAYSPPYRALTLEEQYSILEDIKQSNVQILFVGLGCPKQERWMNVNKNRFKAVMLGIGGAFDVLAEAKPQVPYWMQSLGLEWLFRLILEPRRLWYRNLRHSPRFLAYFSAQILWLTVLQFFQVIS